MSGGGALVLTGFMGAGKSTTARALAAARGSAALDSSFSQSRASCWVANGVIGGKASRSRLP